MVRNCRICGEGLTYQLMSYPAMPKSAQQFPLAYEIEKDEPIELSVTQCLQCGLVQLDNDPVDYYREVIRAAGFSQNMLAFRKQQFSQYICGYQLTGKKVLEVGCGRGEYLTLLQEQGAIAYGIEANPLSAQYCRNQGLNVNQDYVENQAWKSEQAPFSAFFIFNFLEHMPEPIAMLKGIAANLEEGAVGLIEVPNFDMMLRENQFTEFVTDHLSYFSSHTLQLMLNLSGFEVLACDEIWEDYILSAKVRKRQALDASGFKSAQFGLKEQLEAFIKDKSIEKVAVWGAGHQALAVIAMTGFSKQIKYVIDSAPFKQNKLTPGTHVSIVSPEVFFDDSIEALVIMAAAYSDEVAEIVKQRQKKLLQLAILRPWGLEIV